TALILARQHLENIGEAGASVTTKECQFCQ
ncbi:MAG: DUF2024 family protein, partial [Nitrospirales bacterium]|nr:DUF2024 family protein [Nitrospirales bacterium]